ncbi:MAG: GIY-YIG nuclease family protein [Chloroflexi bacterium]|nr:GIY-YIG nuclease family protein [Chloroflexota bacterium]
MPHFVYIVRCANGALYTGYAADVEARVAKHNAGRGAKYTRMNGPVALVAAWEASDRMSALKLERRIKALPRAQKDALLAGARALPAIDGMADAAIFVRRKPRRSGRARKARKSD